MIHRSFRGTSWNSTRLRRGSSESMFWCRPHVILFHCCLPSHALEARISSQIRSIMAADYHHLRKSAKGVTRNYVGISIGSLRPLKSRPGLRKPTPSPWLVLSISCISSHATVYHSIWLGNGEFIICKPTASFFASGLPVWRLSFSKSITY